MLRDADPVEVPRSGVLQSRAGQRSGRDVADLAAALVAAIGFSLFVVQAGGGRDEGSVTKGLLALLPAVLLARPWVRLTPGVLLTAALPALGALYMCLVSPLRWAGADQVATAGYAGLLFITVASLGSSPRRRSLLATGLACTGVLQALDALGVWFADGDLSKLLIGSYFWHNPFAAHVGAAGVLLITAWLAGSGRTRLYALPGAVVCIVAVWLSTSRATCSLVLLLGLIVLGSLMVTAPERRRTFAVRGGVLVLSVVAVLGALAPFTPAPERAVVSSLEGSGSTRLDFFGSALDITRDHPITGVGAGAYGAAATSFQGPLELRARNVHNGVLQAAVEGGLPLAIAYSLPLLLAAGAWCRRVRREAVDLSDRYLLYGAGAAAGLLMAHSLVDFDWTFPALPALLGAVLGLVVAVPSSGATVRPVAARRGMAACCVLLAIAAVAGSVRADAADTAVRSEVLPTTGLAAVGVTGPLRDARFDRLVLLDVQADPVSLRAAVERTADLAERDSPLQWLRSSALLRLGDRDAALALADRRWAQVGTNSPLQAIGYSKVLDAGGRPEAAERVLTETAERLALMGPTATSRVDALVMTLLSRPGGGASPSVGCLAAATRAAFPDSRLPVSPGTPPAPCS